MSVVWHGWGNLWYVDAEHDTKQRNRNIVLEGKQWREALAVLDPPIGAGPAFVGQVITFGKM